MNYTYFAARSDAAAVAVLTRDASPYEPPKPADAGLLSEQIDGVGFSQELGHYARLVLGAGSDIDLEDWEYRIAAANDERRVMLRLPPVLVRAVADSDLDHLHSLVPAWAQFPYFADPDPARRLHAFATDLHRLCRTATGNAGGVYCYGYA
ncbi:hypothetical protein [Actinoplanes sp. DH11]|uniref:hypothetical protein n=1 Tax=Actinoplanes sp. DH11 TaxID=2857011 RepID=UPI001E648AE3|nr:hypothetical protein [Actinoplanes sp. DH11]